ncbi:head-tail joining protein [Stenotrophomonas phage Silvanus]|nr:head-tail joining protein [Stenotrophomonas phage Silvanus]
MALKFLTLDEARTHCRADGEDDDLIELYAEAAEQDAEVSLNRALFGADSELQDAIAALPAAMAVARTERDAALAAADEISDLCDRAEARGLALSAYQDQRFRWSQIRNGIVVDAMLKGAMLMTTAHSYQNRANVVAGQGAAAVQVPLNAEWIYNKRRYMGELL